MDTAEIDIAFCQLMSQPLVGRKLGISSRHAAQLRYLARRGHHVSLRRKISLLQKSGWQASPKHYTRVDLVDLVSFALQQSNAAKELGAEYIVGKFLGKS